MFGQGSEVVLKKQFWFHVCSFWFIRLLHIAQSHYPQYNHSALSKFNLFTCIAIDCIFLIFCYPLIPTFYITYLRSLVFWHVYVKSWSSRRLICCCLWMNDFRSWVKYLDKIPSFGVESLMKALWSSQTMHSDFLLALFRVIANRLATNDGKSDTAISHYFISISYKDVHIEERMHFTKIM